VPIHYLDDRYFELGGVAFEYGFAVDLEPSEPTTPFVWKHRYQLDCYEELLAGRRGANVVELGIHRGGSAILLDRLLEPRRLVAFDLAQEPAPALAHYVAAHGRAETIAAHYGVDQGDKARLGTLCDEAFGAEPIDLVIDDASHQYGPTVASFEVLFPRMRPGALYVVEDWDWAHMFSAGFAAVLGDPNHPEHATLLARMKTRMTTMGVSKPSVLELGRFAMEATLLAAGTRDIVREVRVRHNWIVIERGAGKLPPGPLTIADFAVDRFHALTPREGLQEARFE